MASRSVAEIGHRSASMGYIYISLIYNFTFNSTVVSSNIRFACHTKTLFYFDMAVHLLVVSLISDSCFPSCLLSHSYCYSKIKPRIIIIPQPIAQARVKLFVNVDKESSRNSILMTR
jgi:hypothetical protein